MFHNSAGKPLVANLPNFFVINEAGRGFTLTVYKKPFGVRIYIAGRVWNV